MPGEDKRRPPISYMATYELTVKAAGEIGDALMPRIREAIRAEVADGVQDLRNQVKDLNSQVSALKVRANAWSAFSGAVSGLATALTAALMTRRS